MRGIMAQTPQAKTRVWAEIERVMWAHTTWAVLKLILRRIIRVVRNVLPFFLMAVIVLLAAAQSPSAVERGISGEEPSNVVVSEGIVITDKSLKKDAAVLASHWHEHLPDVGDHLLTEEIGCARKGAVRHRNCPDRQQSAPIFHGVEWNRRVGYPLYDGISLLELIQHGGSPANIDEFKMQTPLGFGVRYKSLILGNETRLGNFEKDVGPFCNDNSFGLFVGRRSPISCGIGSNSRVFHALAHIAQLVEKQGGLQDGNAEKHNSEPREPVRIVRDPLRFESQLFVNYRFLLAVALGLVGLLFGIWGGENFYRERYLVGATLVGCGWLCGLFAWGWLL